MDRHGQVRGNGYDRTVALNRRQRDLAKMPATKSRLQRSYVGLLGRLPDNAGLRYWKHRAASRPRARAITSEVVSRRPQYDDLLFGEVVREFARQPEFQARWGSQSFGYTNRKDRQQFLSDAYQLVLGRPYRPSTDAFVVVDGEIRSRTYGSEELSESVSDLDVVLELLESTEMRARVRTLSRDGWRHQIDDLAHDFLAPLQPDI